MAPWGCDCLRRNYCNNITYPWNCYNRELPSHQLPAPPKWGSSSRSLALKPLMTPSFFLLFMGTVLHSCLSCFKSPTYWMEGKYLLKYQMVNEKMQSLFCDQQSSPPWNQGWHLICSSWKAKRNVKCGFWQNLKSCLHWGISRSI